MVADFCNFTLVNPETLYTDEDLLLKISASDRRAFSTLYNRYWEPLFVNAAKVLRGAEEAEDVLQDVFLSLWKRRTELKITGSVAAYLHTSVRYKAIHYIEKNITRRDYLSLLTNVAVESLPPDSELQLQFKELQKLICDAVAQMPPKMQEVYKLSRQQYLSHQEIADKLGISAETVKKHIQHALTIIKTALSRSSVSISVLLSCLIK
jgi:RNA polymerase sigma-70 factor (family 1)